MTKVIAIVGPTATGKTKLSLQVAEKYKLEIINGDSTQVYKNMDIGTAKITKDERIKIPHHLLDFVNPSEKYTVYNFQSDVRKLYDSSPVSLVVGGTGLYIKASLYDYEFFPEEPINYQTYEGFETDELLHELITLDPKIVIDANNRQRIIRALDMARKGKLRSKRTNSNKLLYDSLIIYLSIDREVLHRRIEERLRLQMEQGFLAEVINLRKQGHKPNVIGYRELNQYLDGIITLAEALQNIIKVTKKYAKRQETWFKNQMNCIYVDALDENIFEVVDQHIVKFLNEK